MGFPPVETASFIFSLKKPFYTQLKKEIKDPAALVEATVSGNEALDQLGLYTTEVHQLAREEVIRRRTIFHDLKLIFMTVPAVLMRRGAK